MEHPKKKLHLFNWHRLCLLPVTSLALQATAQNTTQKGTVVDMNSERMIGAPVQVEGARLELFAPVMPY